MLIVEYRLNPKADRKKIHEYLFKEIPSTSKCIKTTILDLEKLLVESETLYSPLV